MNEINERLTRIEGHIATIDASMKAMETSINEILFCLHGGKLAAREPVQSAEKLANIREPEPIIA